MTILGTKNVFELTRAKAALGAGSRTLSLRLPAAAQKRFRQVLKQNQQARAVVTVHAIDQAGNAGSSRRTVLVRP